MNKKILFVFLALVCFAPAMLSAQTSVKGAAVNGATGVIVTPTARIGWEYADFGIDFGYSFLLNGGVIDHVPAVTFSFLRKAELGVAMDLHENSDWDLLFHGKFQFYREGGSSLAMGLSMDLVSQANQSELETYLTPYIVASFDGKFFGWPATTTMMFGWHMLEMGEFTSNFAFSMGFELALVPSVFKHYIYWISDFANYSYDMNSLIDAGNRGAFNTGIRIDPVKHNKFKFVLDIIGTDLLDSSRGFLAAATFGIGF